MKRPHHGGRRPSRFGAYPWLPICLFACACPPSLAAADPQPLPELAKLDPRRGAVFAAAVPCTPMPDLAAAARHLAENLGRPVRVHGAKGAAPPFAPPVAALSARHYLGLLAWYYGRGVHVAADGSVELGDPGITGVCGLFAEAHLVRLPPALRAADSAALQTVLDGSLARDERYRHGHFAMRATVQRDLVMVAGYHPHFALLADWCEAVTRPLPPAAPRPGLPCRVWPLGATEVGDSPDRAWRGRVAEVLAESAGEPYHTDGQGREWRSLRVPDAATAIALVDAEDTGVMVHPTLADGSSGSSASGLHQTVGRGLRMFAGDVGGRVAIRHGMILIEPRPERPAGERPEPSPRSVWAWPLALPPGFTAEDLAVFVRRHAGEGMQVVALADRLLLLAEGAGPPAADLLSAIHRHFGTNCAYPWNPDR